MTQRTFNIGSVTKTKSGGFEGKLKLMSYTGDITITPITDREEGKNAPDFAVNTTAPNGDLFRVGSAWNKKAKSSGNHYVSLVVDYFEITSQPIWANLAQDRENKEVMNILR